jgi:hypothetical protein
MLTIKNFVAGGALPAYSPVKFTANAGEVVAAVAAGDKVIGVTTDTVAANGERVDVVMFGPAKVVAGAAFAAGDLLMANATSQGIAAAAAAGANVRTFGIAREAAAAANDIVEINVTPGSFQG